MLDDATWVGVEQVKGFEFGGIMVVLCTWTCR